jgi:hypothetical protein
MTSPRKAACKEFELLERQARETPVIGVFDLASLAIGGTDEAVRLGAVLLDLEVEAARLGGH